MQAGFRDTNFKKSVWIVVCVATILGTSWFFQNTQATMTPSSQLKQMEDPYFDNVLVLIQPSSTTSTIVDNSKYARALTLGGSTALSTAVADPWGGNRKVIAMDGNLDYISMPDSNDWAFGTNDLTIEGWFYFNTLGSTTTISLGGQYVDGNNYAAWAIDNNTSNGLGWYVRSAGAFMYSSWVGADQTTPTGTWVHVAYTRSGNDHREFWNGNLIHSVNDNSAVPNYAAVFGLGSVTGTTINGYVGAFRVTTGVARYTKSFTPPKFAFPTQGPRIADPYWNNVVLLIQPNTDSSSIIDLSRSGHTVTAMGNAALSTAVSDPWGWGRKVISLDGTGDYLSIPDNADFDFGAGDVTVEGWYYFPSFTGSMNNGLFMQYQDGNNKWGLNLNNSTNEGLLYVARVGGSNTILYNGGADYTSSAGWKHVAYVRSGNTHTTYMDGVNVASTTDTSVNPNIAGIMAIGRIVEVGGTFQEHTGYLANFRITKGVARYTANFTPQPGPFPTQGLRGAWSKKTIPRWSNIVNYLPMNGTGSIANGATVKAMIGADGTASNAGGTNMSYMVGNIASYINFDGSDNSISLPKDAGNTFAKAQPYSMSLWVYPTNSAGNMQTFITDASELPPYNGHWLQFSTAWCGNSRRVCYAHIDGSSNMQRIWTNASLNLNEWTHIVVTYDGSASATGMKIYLNGSAAATSTGINTAFSGDINKANAWRIGTDASANAENHFFGNIDEVIFWNVELTATEVSSLYQMQTTTP